MTSHDRSLPDVHPEPGARCTRCGADEFRPRAVPRAADVWICNLCGEEFGPARQPDPEAPSAIIIPLCRPAAKLPVIAGPSVSIFAPLRSALP